MDSCSLLSTRSNGPFVISALPGEASVNGGEDCRDLVCVNGEIIMTIVKRRAIDFFMACDLMVSMTDVLQIWKRKGKLRQTERYIKSPVLQKPDKK